jgi:hypothetical protein
MHSIMPADINWLFAAPKLHEPPFPYSRGILEVWRNGRGGLVKSKPIDLDEELR